VQKPKAVGQSASRTLTETGLKQRGSLSVWFDPEMVWTPPPNGKRSRQQQFSDAAIQTCLTTVRQGIAKQCPEYPYWSSRMFNPFSTIAQQCISRVETKPLGIMLRITLPVSGCIA